MSIYKQFKTDQKLEKEGVEFDYGDFKIILARAGGANKRFARLLEQKTKPYKRAIQTETMDNEKALDLLREVYAEAVVLGWATKVKDKWVDGIEDPENPEKTIPATPENILKVLRDLPEIFGEIQEMASKAALYRETVREDDAKN